jgi:hypothetical protein
VRWIYGFEDWEDGHVVRQIAGYKDRDMSRLVRGWIVEYIYSYIGIYG